MLRMNGLQPIDVGLITFDIFLKDFRWRKELQKLSSLGSLVVICNASPQWLCKPILLEPVFFLSPGGTRDIGSALTRMCMRHRSIETKLRHFTMYVLHVQPCLIALPTSLCIANGATSHTSPVLTLPLLSSPFQYSYGRPSHSSPGQDRGMEEDS
jgi:hypothetical protein